MAQQKFSCTVGGGCDYQTELLDAETALKFLELHAKTAHPATTTNNVTGSSSKKPEKFPRPTIDIDSTEETWTDFYSSWQQYKEEYELSGVAITRQLYSCCSSELATSLSRATGGAHFTLTEQQLTEHIKTLAVKYQNPAVKVQEFLGLSQQPEESARHYFARLRGCATHCKFNIKCSCGLENSYADMIIRFKLIAGLSDKEIKEDILSVEDKNLEETLKMIESKESGKHAKEMIGNDNKSTVKLVKTTKQQVGPYRGEKSFQSSPRTPTGTRVPPLNSTHSPNNNQTPNKNKCTHCGRQGHGSTTGEREKSCPAWGKTCGNCGRYGHFSAVCNAGRRVNQTSETKTVEAKDSNDENNSGQAGQISIGELAGLMLAAANINKDVQKKTNVKVPHMLHEQLKWARRAPPDHPMCTVTVAVSAPGYRDNGFQPPPVTRRRQTSMLALADTGCQACCMGPSQLHALGLQKVDLLAPQLSLKTANTSGIDIQGAVFIQISGHDKFGNSWKTEQLCYVATGIEQLLLSRDACEKLGMIPTTFPKIGGYFHGDDATMATIKQMEDTTHLEGDMELKPTPCNPKPDGSCNCPRRETANTKPKFDKNLNGVQLKNLIVNHYAASAFNRCTRQRLPRMEGEPLPIITDPTAKPYAVHNPVPIPLHWEDQVKKDLERDCALGVIEPVPINTPVKWCARMVVVPKHSGEPRRTVDLQALNKASVRQTHHTRTPFALASDVPAKTKKSVLDVWNSFHSVPVRDEDKDKLQFITPFGRFRYLVTPQGYLASGDGYTQRFSNITAKIPNKRTIIDDTVLWSQNVEQNFYDVCQMLETCNQAGLIFNSDKFQFAQDTVEFAGLEITENGVRPSRKFLKSIKDFPRPTNISEVRSFFGMVNQVSYAFAMSETMKDFRHLLRKGSEFIWSEKLQEAFESAKEKIIEEVSEGVQHFEISRTTCLATDWSKDGLGFLLLQKWCDCPERNPRCCRGGWKLVLAGGRFTTPAESRYSPVEGECLAVVDALNKAKHFIIGCKDLIIAVDHRPLLGLLNDKSLADVKNPRLLNLKEKTLWFQFELIHIPGGLNSGPDYMSRYGQTAKETKANEDNLEKSIENARIAALTYDDSLKAVTFNRIKTEGLEDEETKLLKKMILNCQEPLEWPKQIEQYKKYKDDLYIQEQVVMYNGRVVVPVGLRQEVLAGLHGAHQCIERMHKRAMSAVFWPGIYGSLELVRNSCSYCNKNAPTQQRLPPRPLQLPDYPFQMIVADYCDIKGKSWLIVADRFTGWLSAYYFPKEAITGELIKLMKNHFSTFGVPENFTSDNGPQFRSKVFNDFLKQWGVNEHRISSDYFPHSNLRAESAVKTCKRMITANTTKEGSPIWDKILQAMMTHRNTPVNDLNFSPAQLLFGRPIRDFLPIKPGNFRPSDVWIDNREKRELAMKNRLNAGGERWTQSSKELPQLQQGETVYIQNQRSQGKLGRQWDRTGTIIEHCGNDKYKVRVDGSGRVTDRNRQFLRSFKSVKKPTFFPGPRPNSGNNENANIAHDMKETFQQEPTTFENNSPSTNGDQSSAPYINSPHTNGDQSSAHSNNSPSILKAVYPKPTLPNHNLTQTFEEVSQPEENNWIPQSPDIQPEPKKRIPQQTNIQPEPRRSTRVRKPNPRYNEEEFDLKTVMKTGKILEQDDTTENISTLTMKEFVEPKKTFSTKR